MSCYKKFDKILHVIYNNYGENNEKIFKKYRGTKDLSRKNKYLTQKEWDDYAQEKGLFSSTTIKSHFGVYTWYDIRNKLMLEKREEKINRKIENMRKELYKNIEKEGLNSEKTIQLANQFDNIMNIYYQNNKHKGKGRYYKDKEQIGEEYKRSYEHLKSLTNEEDFPSVSDWDKYAIKTNCLSSTSMKDISGMNWHKLRDKVKTDINLEGFKKY